MKKLLRGLSLAFCVGLIGFALTGCGGGSSSGSNPGDGYKVEGYIKVDESLLTNSRAAMKPVKSTVRIAELCNVGHYIYETTETGYYVFNNVPAGHYNICATADGNADLCITAPITVDGNTNVPETNTILQKGNKYTVNLVDKNNQKLNADAEVFLLGISYPAGKSLAAFETKAISKNVTSAEAIVTIAKKEYKETLKIDPSKSVLTLTVTNYTNSSEPEPIPSGKFYAGTGTVSDPYQIKTPEHLCNVTKEVETNRAACFKLVGNINMTGVKFEPIYGFEGTFDGNNLTISNLTVECDSQAALFQQTFNATLENIYLTNVKATAKSGGAAGLVGAFLGKGTITNCKVSSAVITDNGTVDVSSPNLGKYTGGIVGLAEDGSSTITRCSFQGTITGNTFVAGIVGNGANKDRGYNTTVSTCIANGTINGKASVHQYANNCIISNCSGDPIINIK